MDEELVLDPARRRRWLLAKALETAPLVEALALAQAAEDFLSGNAARNSNRQPTAVATPSGTALSGTKEHQEKSLTALPTQDAESTTTEAFMGLTSLTSLDGVILYLRQSGEDLSPESQNADELLAHANRKRADQGLPPFALLPTTVRKTAQQDGANPVERVRPVRPLSARERAEWARRVITSPIEAVYSGDAH